MSEVQAFKQDFEALLNELDERDTKIQLVRHTGRTFNDANRSLDPGTTTNIDVNGVSHILNKPVKPGTAVQSGDVRVLLDSAVAPVEDDNVLIDGLNYSIIALNTFNPGGVLIGYELQVRRG